MILPPGTADTTGSGEIVMAQTRHNLRIGLCDPDPIIAGMAQRLAGGSHQVRICTSPQDLLQACMRGEIDVVVSDLDTPFLDGLQLHTSLRTSGCDVGMVLTVANLHDMRLRPSLPAGLEILLKPYRRTELLTAIDRAMMRRTDGA
jgi:CheY-like chemotaxis protein